MQGTRMERVESLLTAAGLFADHRWWSDERSRDPRARPARRDAQVGIFLGRLSLAEAFATQSDRADGLWPTVVVDEYDRALGLCYSNIDSLRRAFETHTGVYWSRKRGLWEKGASSGATQALLSVGVDCDRDTLVFRVKQHGPGFCHLRTCSCFGELGGLPTLSAS